MPQPPSERSRLIVAIDGPSGSGKSSTARGVARRLGLATGKVSGFLVAGANPLARAVAKVLKDEGQPVVVVDHSHDHSRVSTRVVL